MTSENEQTLDGCYVSDKTNTVQNAFWEGVLGKEVNIYIQNQGEDTFKVLQVDQYFIIVEHETDGFMLINKQSIVTVVPPESATPDLIKSLADGVRKINYKPSEKRVERNKKKLQRYNRKPQHNHSPRDNYNTEEKPYYAPTPSRNVEVKVKQKRTFTYEQRD